MDAQRPIPKFRPKFRPKVSQVARTLVVRLGLAWLTIVLAIGVWQGYGPWLLGGGGGDAF